MMIPRSFIQDLLARIDIVDVIERHLTLKKGGANYFACCPFHGEKTPSFSISPSKQFYHCFGCGVHGNVISFLMEYSGLSFVEAVEELARQAGLQVPREQSGDSISRVQRSSEHDALLAAMDRAAHFYCEQLRKSPVAIDYLKRRGLSGEIAARFGVGFAPPGWQALEAAFPDYQAKTLVEAGLVTVNEESGRRYDRFRERIMFPIQDRRGRVIAFGGRILDSGEPKYLNSPETPLFEKGRELYGIRQAMQGIREAGYSLVVEGYMDVLALAQYGIGNAVATLGTATTPHHIQSLLRYADRIVFCFDGDKAGRKAAWRALESSLEALRDDAVLAFLFLPSEHDPDSFVRSEGADALRSAAASALPLADFLLNHLQEECELDTAEGRARLVHEARPLITRVGAPLLKLQLLKALADISGLTQREIEHAFGLDGANPSPGGSAPPAHSRRPGMTRRPVPSGGRRQKPAGPTATLLRLLLQNPSWATRIPAELIPDEDAEGRALIALIDAASIGEFPPPGGLAAIIEMLRDSPHHNTVAASAAELISTHYDEAVLDTLFDDTLNALVAQRLEREITDLTSKERDSGLDPMERRRLAELIMEKHKTRSSAKA